MCRSFRIALVLLPFLFLGALVGPVYAGADDEIPGVPLAIGVTVSGTVDSEDIDDVYAITLADGQEVHIRCDPGSAGGAGGALHLLVPGASSISDPGNHEELAKKITSVLLDEDRAKELSQKALNIARSEYSLVDTVRRLEAIYEAALSAES